MLTKKRVLFYLSIFLFLLFIVFSYLVAKEKFTQFDFDTTVKFQDNLPSKFDFPFSIFSLIGMAEITGLVWLGIFTLALIKKSFLTAAALLLLPIGLAIEIFGKIFLYHPAPPHLFYKGVLNYEFPSHFVHTNYSYPSGHVLRTSFLIFFISVWILLKVSPKKQIFIQPILFIVLGGMLISRIYLGEHWTSDVIGGLLLGSSFGILAGVTIPKPRSK